LPSPIATPSVQPIDNGQWIAFPASAPIEQDVPYAYRLYVHCGLDGVPIDFDGSLWDVASVARPAEAGSGTGLYEEGVVTVVGADGARFDGDPGLVVLLRRHDGGKSFTGCD
jgi:hypothetical protein